MSQVHDIFQEVTDYIEFASSFETSFIHQLEHSTAIGPYVLESSNGS